MGFELLDRKRNIIVREMMLLIDRAADIQSKIDTCYAEAYQALQRANVAHGICEDIAQSVPVENGLSLSSRSVMGVEIPLVSLDAEPVELSYGFMDTSALVDEAYIKFDQVKKLTAELAEVENSVYRLATAVNKTQKRANALRTHFAPADLTVNTHPTPGREGAGGFLPAQGDQSPEKRRPERVGSSRPKPPNTGAFCCISRSHHVY